MTRSLFHCGQKALNRFLIDEYESAARLIQVESDKYRKADEDDEAKCPGEVFFAQDALFSSHEHRSGDRGRDKQHQDRRRQPISHRRKALRLAGAHRVECVGKWCRNRRSIGQRLGNQRNHLAVHLIKLEERLFEFNRIVCAPGKIDSQGRVFADNLSQSGSFRFFEQARAGVKVPDRIAVRHHHNASLIMLA
ncbi:MAG TPA: hypothetical protein VGR40_06540 [Candidatus Binatus sp.]|nr:hypothetical protein [Candidatus Binatus sp.]